MRRNLDLPGNGNQTRARVITALGVACALALGACSGGDDTGSEPLAAARATTTSTEPETTASAAAVTDTTRPPGATTTTPPRTPEYVNGVPQVKASPSRGAIGSRISIEGYGFTEENWRAQGASLWLVASTSGCALYADAQHTVRVSADGRLTGEFVVPASGACRMSSAGESPLQAGSYRIAFQCTACMIGQFEVTASENPTTAVCNDVGFSPNSDNLASTIVATGVPCPEAEAFVRKVGGPLGPINGLPRVEADGFVCERTSQDERGLPSATYVCTSGSKRITFVRT
jgi:hypothetical protein